MTDKPSTPADRPTPLQVIAAFTEELRGDLLDTSRTPSDILAAMRERIPGLCAADVTCASGFAKLIGSRMASLGWRTSERRTRLTPERKAELAAAHVRQVATEETVEERVARSTAEVMARLMRGGR